MTDGIALMGRVTGSGGAGMAGGRLSGTAPAQRFLGFTYQGSDAAAEAPLAPGHFRNPVLAGWHPDPGICRVGDDYYLVTSTFVCFPGLPVMHSRDLVNWRLIGHAVTEAQGLQFDGLGISRGLFAPTLSWHAGRFYLCCTMVDGGGNFMLTATDPAGPWSAPQWLDFEGIDPSLFFDDDGTAWLLNNGAPEGPPRYSGHRAIWQQAFDVRRGVPTGPRRVLVDGGADPRTQPVWIEGPHLFRRHGWTYLCAAEGGTSTRHSQVIFRSRLPTGPFVPWAHNPILTQRGLDDRVPGAVSCTGHAQLFIGPDSQWWASFLGCRPGPDGHWLTGRETFLLPVRWTDDDWPVILPPGERVPLQVRSPRGAAPDVAASPTPLNGNFTRSDTFGPAPLAPDWVALRGPHGAFARSDAHGLLLQPHTDTLAGRGRPAFLARRVAHAAFEVSATLLPPTVSGVQAGLALFQSENQHLQLTLQRRRQQPVMTLTLNDGGHHHSLAELPIHRPAGRPGDGPGEPVTLQLRCDGRHIHATCIAAAQGSVSPPPLSLPVAVDASRLSVQAAGGGLHFTGLLAGLVATQEPAHA